MGDLFSVFPLEWVAHGIGLEILIHNFIEFEPYVEARESEALRDSESSSDRTMGGRHRAALTGG